MLRRPLLILVFFLLIATSLSFGVERRMGFSYFVSRIFPVSRAAAILDTPPTTHALFTKLLRGIGIDDPSYSFSFDDLFSSRPRDIYFALFEKLTVSPYANALKEVSKAYQLSLSDSEMVIQGIITPLLQGKKQYTQQQAIADLGKVQRSFQTMLAHERIRQKTSALTAGYELFANGSLEDSSFDLIHDLSLIEEILTLDRSKILYNQYRSLSNPASSLRGVAGGEILLGGSGGALSELREGGAGQSVNTFGDAKGAAFEKDTSKEEFSTDRAFDAFDAFDAFRADGDGQTMDDQAAAEAKGNSAPFCPYETPLERALRVYGFTHPSSVENSKSVTSAAPSNIPAEEFAAYKNSLGTQGAKFSAEKNTTQTTTPNIALLPGPELTLANPKLQKKAARVNEPFCNGLSGTPLFTYQNRIDGVSQDIFCLTADKKERVYRTYFPGRSCVRCLLAGMNESMKKLLSRNIAPNKITGSIFESSKCKSALNLPTMLNMNVVFIPAPVLTPLKYRALKDKEFSRLFEALSLEEREAKKASNPDSVKRLAGDNAKEGVTQGDLFGEISRGLAATTLATNARVAARYPVNSMDSESEVYRLIISEMRQMTSYFAGFKDILDHFNEKTCQKFENKPSL